MKLRALLIAVGIALASNATGSFAQSTPTARLELSQASTVQSGIGVISGWSCNGNVQVVIDGTAYATGHGTSRGDGLAGTFTLNGFPSANKSVTVQWQELQQNFAIVAVTATSAGGFPITFKGIRMDSLKTAAAQDGRTCEATLSFTSTTSSSHFAALYFDVMQQGVVKDQVIFPAFDIAAGKSVV